MADEEDETARDIRKLLEESSKQTWPIEQMKEDLDLEVYGTLALPPSIREFLRREAEILGMDGFIVAFTGVKDGRRIRECMLAGRVGDNDARLLFGEIVPVLIGTAIRKAKGKLRILETTEKDVRSGWISSFVRELYEKIL